MKLVYEGENNFTADMEFWKLANAKAKGVIVFNDVNKLVGSGTYKYYESDITRFLEHFGTLELFRFDEHPDIIYMKYQHVFPREHPHNNPDANRGWQVWKKEE